MVIIIVFGEVGGVMYLDGDMIVVILMKNIQYVLEKKEEDYN
jgi:hypothetical protein